MGSYICQYKHRNGEICNKGCCRPEGCFLHYKSPIRRPCKECNKPTYSKYDTCDKHAMKHRKKEQYYRKKAEINAQNMGEGHNR